MNVGYFGPDISATDVSATENAKGGRFGLKETNSATMNIFLEKKYFLFKSFVKVELSYVFTINLFTIAENCMEEK